MPLHPAACDALQPLMVGRGAGVPVFRTRGGARIPAGRGARLLKPDLVEAEVDYKTAEGYADFHSLRVTFATLLAAGGTRPREAQELLRHADVRLTLNTYTKTDAEAGRAAVAALPIGGKPETK